MGDPPDYVHGVHADVPFQDLDRAELYFGKDVAPGYFAWAVPFGDGMARLGVLAEQGGRQLFERFLRRQEIRSRLPSGEEQDLERIRRRRLRSRGIVQGMVRPSFAERTLAVGEAAGQVKTTTAGGIYYGLIGAEVAARVLCDSLDADDSSSSRLAAYEEAWWDRLGGEIAAGLELQRVGREMSNEEIDRLFEALQDGVAGAVRAAVRFDWHRPALEVLFGRKEAWSFWEKAQGLPSFG
jgi:flavin-dependent dehydrogenase